MNPEPPVMPIRPAGCRIRAPLAAVLVEPEATRRSLGEVVPEEWLEGELVALNPFPALGAYILPNRRTGGHGRDLGSER